MVYVPAQLWQSVSVYLAKILGFARLGQGLRSLRAA